MKKIAFIFGFGALFLAGCPKHEIIPAPEQRVELTPHFEGNINGTDVELTENVQGFFLETTKTKIIQTSPTPSEAVYFADFKSSDVLNSIKIGVGSVFYDGSLNSGDPTITLFNSFMSGIGATPPDYSDGGTAGFEVTYRDGNGLVWKTDETMVAGSSVAFANIVQESDNTGDYSKFTCTFDCTVYRWQGDTLLLSIPITDAVYSGWFKR